MLAGGIYTHRQIDNWITERKKKKKQCGQPALRASWPGRGYVSTTTDAAAAAILRLCIRRRGCTLKALAVASSNTLRINVCQIAARRRFAPHHAIPMHAQMRCRAQRRSMPVVFACLRGTQSATRD